MNPPAYKKKAEICFFFVIQTYHDIINFWIVKNMIYVVFL